MVCRLYPLQPGQTWIGAVCKRLATLTITNIGAAQTIQLTNIGSQTVFVLFNDLVNTATA
jgi:hypothetical protein